jgi:DNA-binding response OmpR family regulator
LRTKTIMLVDDDEDLVAEIAEILKSEGYNAVPFTDSVEAGHKALVVMPDLLLVDLRMGGQSGFQLANAISHKPETSHIPIVAMTGYYDEEKYRGLMHIVGIRNCLRKPFKPEDLLRVIDGLLRARRPERCHEGKEVTNESE